MTIAASSIFNLISVDKTLKNTLKKLIRPGKNTRFPPPLYLALKTAFDGTHNV